MTALLIIPLVLATVTALYSGPTEGGCVNPFPLASALPTHHPAPLSIVPPNWYANKLVGATMVVSPENTLYVEDGRWAILTDTSVLTLSFNSAALSGIGLVVYHPVESTCNWVWVYTRYYTDLSLPPLLKTDYWVFMAGGEWGTIGDGLTVAIAPHKYVVITTNTLLWVDAVYYVTPAKIFWFPIMLRGA